MMQQISYSPLTTSSVQVRIYPDCIKIINEGSLPDSLSIDDLKTEHLSVPRNPLLADIFYKSGLIESWGTGTLKILNLCSKNGLPEPVFENLSNSFSVTIYRPDQKTDQKKTNIDNQIIDLIEKNKHITVQEMAGFINRGQTVVKERLKILKSSGKIERIGPAKGGFWVVKV